MKKYIFLFALYLLCSSHDMYLKLDTYFLKPNTQSTIQLFNGTFEKSDNIITRDRMLDVSLVGNGKRINIDSSSWSDLNKTTILKFSSGEEGTWVAGVSTKARNIEMDAKDFNDYLVHDGVLDMLDFRKQNNLINNDAIEKYSKHVKTIFQVGDKKTMDWNTILGYPIEFVPLQNPYESNIDEELQVQLLWKGKPIDGQLVYVGNEDTSHTHDENGDHHHHNAKQYRTNEKGVITFKLNAPGQWYVRTIVMEESKESGLTHESNWATLTFEVLSNSDDSDGMHVHADGTTHSHASSSGLNKYLLLLVGAIVILGFWIILGKRRKQSN